MDKPQTDLGRLEAAQRRLGWVGPKLPTDDTRRLVLTITGSRADVARSLAAAARPGVILEVRSALDDPERPI